MFENPCLANAIALALLLESLLEKAIQSLRFSWHCLILALFLLRSFALLITLDGITDFGISLAKNCNLAFCPFVLRIDWVKPFLTNHAMTCGVNTLNNFIYLSCNTTIVTIGEVRFHHILSFMTKQRYSSAAATSRLHQKFGVIDASVATSDILTRHQMCCSQINFWCLMFCRQIWCWLGCFYFPQFLSH